MKNSNFNGALMANLKFSLISKFCIPKFFSLILLLNNFKYENS